RRLPEAGCSHLGKLVGTAPSADRLVRKLISIQTASDKRIRPANHGATANDKRENNPRSSGSLFHSHLLPRTKRLMRVTIFRGSQEVGGSCIEVQSGKTR